MGPRSAVLDPVFETGAILSRRYRLDAAIASGGMGTVFRATHLALGHDVAIKVLHERALNDDAMKRFAREAKIAAQLSELSRNVVRVIDYGVEQGRPFLVMELLRGEDLRERLEREPRLSPALVVDIAEQLADALDLAHEEGVVHRDVKPANVFLGRSRDELVVKLMDFGVAQRGDATLGRGLVLGTPAFMAPEQIEGQPVDRRADLWALAAIVYRMLTGVLPFGNGSISDIGTAILNFDPDPPSAVVRSLPPEIDAFMERALAKEPAARFTSAPELVAELRSALGVAPGGYPALGRNSSGMRRVRPAAGWLWLAAGATFAMLLVVLILLR